MTTARARARVPEIIPRNYSHRCDPRDCQGATEGVSFIHHTPSISSFPSRFCCTGSELRFSAKRQNCKIAEQRRNPRVRWQSRGAAAGRRRYKYSFANEINVTTATRAISGYAVLGRAPLSNALIKRRWWHRDASEYVHKPARATDIYRLCPFLLSRRAVFLFYASFCTLD